MPSIICVIILNDIIIILYYITGVSLTAFSSGEERASTEMQALPALLVDRQGKDLPFVSL